MNRPQNKYRGIRRLTQMSADFLKDERLSCLSPVSEICAHLRGSAENKAKEDPQIFTDFRRFFGKTRTVSSIPSVSEICVNLRKSANNKTKKNLWIFSRVLLFLLFLLTVPVIHAANLIPDASFETGPRAWFSENGQDPYYAIRERVPHAADGQYVLAISGWNLKGSIILSPLIPLEGTTFSAAADIRLRKAGPEIEVELLLLDAEGRRILASFGKTQPGTAWSQLKGEGITLPAGTSEGRLGLRISGPQKGMTLEVDRMGLFSGASLEPISDNGEAWTIEAATLAKEKAWRVVPPKGGDMYSDPALSQTLLLGDQRLSKEESGEVSQTLRIRQGGKYRLWARFLQSQHDLPGDFSVSLRQGGHILAQKTVDTSSAAGKRPWHWRWESLDVELEPGDAELVLDRSADAGTPYERRIDLFHLTRVANYEARDEDFRTPIYMRFTSQSEGVEPFCLWIFLRRAIGPLWYATPGMLGSGGLFPGYAVPTDREKWIAPGETTPWVKISNFLALSDWGGGTNNIQMLATRKSHTDGMAQERIRGVLEFAIGDERRIVKTIPIDQSAPRILFTVSAEPGERGEGIVSSAEYLARGEAALKGVPESHTPPARHIEVSAHLSLRDGMDDPELLNGELRILKRLGVNNTFHPIASPGNALTRNKELGLLPNFSIAPLAALNTLEEKGEAALEESVVKQAETYKPILDRIHCIIMADEPGAPSYEALVKEPKWETRFREWLKNVPLSTLGVSSWEEVRPVGPAEKTKYPELFYQTGLFRLHAAADLAKKAQRVYARHFPPTALATVNLSPGLFMGTSNDHGMDDYLLFREGGLGMMWTEDWPGHGASLQQMAGYLAMLRVAGRPNARPLGGYLVVREDPVEQRVKTYIWLQEGARTLNLYAYGPAYASVDSWAEGYAVYPELAKLGEEIRRLDAVVEGAQRLRPQIAILYNRTAGIWNDFANNTEQDARYIHWALAHAGYDADIIPEEDIEAGALTNYRLLYLNGPQLRRETAENISAWVQNGGVLVGTAGAGTRDISNRPTNRLDEVFGISSVGLVNANQAGRGRYETRTLPSLGEIQSVPTEDARTPPSITFQTLGVRETLKPHPGATVFLQRGEKPAGTIHAWGKGIAIRLAALPGLAYLQEAIAEKWPGFLPTAYRAEMRDFIAWPAKLAGVEPVVSAKSEPLATITRWDHPERTLLYVINYAGAPAEDFHMILPNAEGFTTARTLQGKSVKLKPTAEGSLEIRFPLNVADAVVLEYPKENP